ncbi:sigma-70 family RNA polymerase sigma factor [Bradyrhizobium sp. CSA207]|uniref:sigma-70 family RNA polymerase sigma factor n=1 Tax=Bradyrhizobium sp. CSA207 TaxID=2698826 RepID=UPI0023AFCB73|nr:sigma-70 family RNA polymerase sigma factor [Bradyrhizobium sp. CSA207]MDE5441436.1 sigma-70 family RNA polymerase sigma factor [Bradyrhizobium sp. CSA207]
MRGQNGADDLHGVFATLRPKLHRYCARMTGSVIDAEDIVQDAMAKAVMSLREPVMVRNTEGWIFRIAHNAALDFLRQRTRQQKTFADEHLSVVADDIDRVQQRQLAAAGLRTFMRLSAAERSAVVLMDVLGYSLEEIGGITESSIPAVKAALHRGRQRLRTIKLEPDDRPPPTLSAAERTRLSAYVDRFNARDFDSVRDMLAEDVRVELVGRTRLRGAEAGRYFGNYEGISDWHLRLGVVEGRLAVIVTDPAKPDGPPSYFILLDWRFEQVGRIRDFRYVGYITESADISFLTRPHEPRTLS